MPLSKDRLTIGILKLHLKSVAIRHLDVTKLQISSGILSLKVQIQFLRALQCWPGAIGIGSRITHTLPALSVAHGHGLDLSQWIYQFDFHFQFSYAFSGLRKKGRRCAEVSAAA